MEKINLCSMILLTLCVGLNIVHTSGSSSATCGNLPPGFQLQADYTLLEIVKSSPYFELMVPNETINEGFVAGCNTYFAIDYNNTVINFRVAVYSDGSITIRFFMVRQTRPGSLELAGFPQTNGSATRVAYESFFASSCDSCDSNKGLILGVIRTFCYASNNKTEPYIYAVSLQPNPPSQCVNNINNTVNNVANDANFNIPALFLANYSQPYQCVTKFNGVKVANAHKIPKENSIELTSQDLKNSNKCH